MCVLSYVNVMEVSCSSFMSHVCFVWSFSHCLHEYIGTLAVVAQLCLHEYIGTLAKVAQLCPSSRHNFVYCSSKVTVSSACMTAFGQNIIAMIIVFL